METVGKYRILRRLGQGGMGAVYEAFDEKIKRRVAINVLKAEYANSIQVVMRFVHDAQIANSVAHPGTIEIFDHGCLPSGEAYLGIEILSGCSLRIPLSHRPTLPVMKTLLTGAEHRVPPPLLSGRSRALRIALSVGGGLIGLIVLMSAFWHRRPTHEMSRPTYILPMAATQSPPPVIAEAAKPQATTSRQTEVSSAHQMAMDTPLCARPEPGRIGARAIGRDAPREWSRARSPQEATALLKQAQLSYNHADCEAAFRTLKELTPSASALSFEDAQRGFYLLGRASCRTGKLGDAIKAFRSLGGADSSYARAARAGDCQKKTLKCQSLDGDELYSRIAADGDGASQRSMSSELRNPYER